MSKKINIVYLLNGSIGDFLMVLLMLDTVKKDKYKCHISTPRNYELFRSLAKEYPEINIVKYPLGLLGFVFCRNIFITPPTPGKLPYHQKFFARLVSIFFGTMAGFDDKEKINKFLYDVLVPYRTDILFYELLNSVLEDLNIDYEKKPLKFKTLSKPKNSETEYIVFHPFGASRGRSFVDEKLVKIIFFIRKYFPNYKLYITGSNEDKEKIIKVQDDQIVYCFGKNMEELVSLILGSSLFIGVDTGITHIANLLTVKTLVFAEQGTPHWLPYYNPKASIVYSILDEKDPIYEGRDHLFSAAKGRTRYLDRIPLSVIEQYIQKTSYEK